MTDGVAFHQRIDQQYSALDEDEQRRFDEMVGRLQRGGIAALPSSDRERASEGRTGASMKLWIVRFSSDVQAVVEEGDGALTVQEITRTGRIQFYQDLTEDAEEEAEAKGNTVPADLPPRTRKMLEALGPATEPLDLDVDTRAWIDAAHEKHK